VTNRESISEEFEAVALGDKRLERRLKKIAIAMESAPEDSLVEQAGDVAALEATYRFFANERVRPEVIFDGHAAKTVERAAAHDSVLVIHDTTDFRFGGSKERKGLGRLSTQRRNGLQAHFSICVSTQGEPLGALELLAWSRLDAGKRPKLKTHEANPDRESQRWVASAERTSERLFGTTSPIHVMDREGDQFELFASLSSSGERFVVRLAHNRRLKGGRGKDDSPRLHDVLASSPARFTRTVQIGRRGREPQSKKRKIFPQRSARSACLEIRSKQIDVHRAHQHAAHLPDSLCLNFVEAREVNVPEGASPVLWRLITTEPIDSATQVAEVIDIYRKRWLIEEYFKVLKTGCRFESHQLEDIKGLLVALSIESAIAWQLLQLRHLAHHEPSASADTIMTPLQMHTLARIRGARDDSEIISTINDVVDELSRLGVHLKNNGPPGWIVLKRGMRKLNILAEGIQLAGG